jgi:hypothetical protein
MLRRSALCLLIVLVSFACGGSPTSPSEPSSPSTPSGPSTSPGTLNVRITDSPFGRAQAVLVTFSEVALLRTGGGWTRLPFPDGGSTWTCDLKKLENDAEDLLGVGPLPLAEYTAIRVTIQNARVFADNPSRSPTPCARTIVDPAGNVHPMTVASREGTTDLTVRVTGSGAASILIDFDGEASVSQDSAGTYVLSPVIRFLR